MEKFFLIFLAVTLGLALLFLLASYFSFVYVFKRRKKEISPYIGLDGEDESGRKAFSKSLIDSFLLQKPTKEVYIDSFDGLKLYGRIYLRDEKAPFEIAFHGYRSLACRDLSGGAMESIRREHNLLLIDERAHGKSEGSVISFGILERRDVLSWADYIAKNYPESKIILMGISMGASSVLMASEYEMKNVCAVIADSPYSAPCEIIKKVAGDMHLPARLIYPFVRLGARLYGKFDLEESAPYTAVERASVPILIIHGEGDDFVPADMSRKIRENNEKICLETFPDAPHGLSYVFDRERYVRITNEFIYTNLNLNGEN